VKDQEFNERLAELMARIEHLPQGERERIEQLARETRRRHERMRETVGQLQESLDYLRLSVKYLVFDLEATRRENKYLRDLLKNGGGQEREDDADAA